MSAQIPNHRLKEMVSGYDHLRACDVADNEEIDSIVPELISAREHIDALEAECERWSGESAAAVAEWNKLKPKIAALKSQVKTLREALTDCAEVLEALGHKNITACLTARAELAATKPDPSNV